MKYKRFETERLKIIPTSQKDAEFILELFNSPKWLKYIGDRNVRTVEDAKNYIKTKMLPQLWKYGYSNYIITNKADKKKIGTVGLFDREGLEGIDIGFAFLPEYEKRGFAFEAANRVKIAAFEDFGLKMLSGITTKDNVASQKLLEKLGLKLTGTIKLLDKDEELLHYKIEK